MLVQGYRCGDCWYAKGSGECPRWQPANYSESFVEQISKQQPINPYNLSCDPYKDSGCETDPPQPTNFTDETVCAHHFSPTCDNYTLVSHPSLESANEAGGIVTHYGRCGTCSTRQDLAVYMKIFDMVGPGKSCSVIGFFSEKRGIKCFEKLGLTRPCAATWMYNAFNSSKKCFGTCIINFFNPWYNGPVPHCKLNTCINCDEEESGPLFKLFAGRSCRGSGLANAITRPCDTVR